MVKAFLTVLLFWLPLLGWSQQGEVCFTFDDLPVVGYSQHTVGQHKKITEKLLASVQAYGIPATGFVNEDKLYTAGAPDSLKIGLLRLWLENGLELGNHSFSHQNYHKVSFKVYTEDILKGETICRELVSGYAKEFQYFRHPYLRIGKSKEAHDSLSAFLHAHGYVEAPVSIDNADYLFAAAYDKALLRNDQALMQKIGESYIRYMEEKLQFYQEKSQELFGRNIRHILLLHANALNADYLAGLADMYRRNGYGFISLKAALEDPAYQTSINSYGDWGISWIDRWAMSQGKKGSFFKGDPDTPAFIQELLK